MYPHILSIFPVRSEHSCCYHRQCKHQCLTMVKCDSLERRTKTWDHAQVLLNSAVASSGTHCAHVLSNNPSSSTIPHPQASYLYYSHPSIFFTMDFTYCILIFVRLASCNTPFAVVEFTFAKLQNCHWHSVTPMPTHPWETLQLSTVFIFASASLWQHCLKNFHTSVNWSSPMMHIATCPYNYFVLMCSKQRHMKMWSLDFATLAHQ
jgi:hypothetical protein